MFKEPHLDSTAEGDLIKRAVSQGQTLEIPTF